MPSVTLSDDFCGDEEIRFTHFRIVCFDAPSFYILPYDHYTTDRSHTLLCQQVQFLTLPNESTPKSLTAQGFPR